MRSDDHNQASGRTSLSGAVRCPAEQLPAAAGIVRGVGATCLAGRGGQAPQVLTMVREDG